MKAAQRFPLLGLLLATLVGLPLAVEPHETLALVRPSEVTLNWSASYAPPWLPDVYIQDFSIDALPLPTPPAAAPTAAACSSLCRSEPACSYFRYCERQANCTDGTGGQLAYQHCQLLKAECSVAAQGVPAETLSGFPVHHTPPGVLSAISVELARGISGADFDCAGSEMPGMCCLSDPLRAVLLCSELEQCRSMVALMGGLDGCSQTPMYVLKTDILTDADAFVSSDAFTLLLADEGAQPGSLFLLASEATVQGPSYDELEAAGGPGAAAAAPYKGCIVAPGVIFQGAATGSISGVTSAEECCRECAKRLAAVNTSERCNVWNHCTQEAGCDYDSPHDATRHVHMRQWECQMLYQEGAVAAGDAPPFVLAKGAALPFTAGAPLAACEPSVEGYDLVPGVSPFLYGSYACQGSLRPQAGECVLLGSPQELADRCSADPQCKAFVMSLPAALDSLNGSASGPPATVGVLKTGAPQASLFVVPAGVLYVQAGGSASGLSGGAIAGIAVGAAAGAVLLAAAAWLLLARRRRGPRLRQADAEGCPCCGSGTSGSCSSEAKGGEGAKGPASAADLPRAASAASMDAAP